MKRVLVMSALIAVVAGSSRAALIELFHDSFTGTTLDPMWTVVNGYESTGEGFIGTNFGTETDGGSRSTASGGYAWASLAGIPSDATSITISWAAWENTAGWSIVSVDGTHSDPTMWAPTNAAYMNARPSTANVHAGGTGGGDATQGSWTIGTKGAWRQYEMVLSGTSGVVEINAYVKSADGSQVWDYAGQFGTPFYTSADFEANYISLAGSVGSAWIDEVNVSYIPEPATIALLGLGVLPLLRRRKR